MRRYSAGYKPRSLRKIENKAKKRFIWTIIITIGLIYFIFFWGLPAFIGGLSVLNKSKHSTVITTDNGAIAPPVLNIPFDSTNSAILKINGYSSPNSKVEIYFDDQLKTTTDTNSDGSFSTDDLDLILGTNNIYGKTLSDQTTSLPSKTIRVYYSNDKPKLDLNSPTDNQQIKGGDKKINVSGKAENATNLTVNGTTIVLNNDGGFSIDVSLNDGDNIIAVIATNSVGNSTQIQKTVNYASQ